MRTVSQAAAADSPLSDKLLELERRIIDPDDYAPLCCAPNYIQPCAWVRWERQADVAFVRSRYDLARSNGRQRALNPGAAKTGRRGSLHV
jgi:hypothetical protein